MLPHSEPTNLKERRRKPRTDCNYRAVIMGWDAKGDRFNQNGWVTNLSSCGIFFVADDQVRDCEAVNVKIALPTGSLKWGTSNLALNGQVIRRVPQADGRIGVAIYFKDHKFF